MTSTDHDNSMADIVSRLEKLESCVFKDKVLKCGGLSVVDKSGNCRILLTLTEEGEPVIAIMRADGDAAMSIEAIGGRPEIALYREDSRDEDNNDAVKLTVCEDGNGHIFVSRNDADSLAHLGTLESSESRQFGLSVWGGESELYIRYNRTRNRACVGASSGEGEVALMALLGDEDHGGDEVLAWIDEQGQPDRVFSKDSE